MATNHDQSFGANQNHSFEEIEISAGSNSLRNDSLAPHFGELCVSNGGSQSNKSIPTGTARTNLDCHSLILSLISQSANWNEYSGLKLLIK